MGGPRLNSLQQLGHEASSALSVLLVIPRVLTRRLVVVLLRNPLVLIFGALLALNLLILLG